MHEGLTQEQREKIIGSAPPITPRKFKHCEEVRKLWREAKHGKYKSVKGGHTTYFKLGERRIIAINKRISRVEMEINKIKGMLK